MEIEMDMEKYKRVRNHTESTGVMQRIVPSYEAGQPATESEYHHSPTMDDYSVPRSVPRDVPILDREALITPESFGAGYELSSPNRLGRRHTRLQTAYAPHDSSLCPSTQHITNKQADGDDQKEDRDVASDSISQKECTHADAASVVENAKVRAEQLPSMQVTRRVTDTNVQDHAPLLGSNMSCPVSSSDQALHSGLCPDEVKMTSDTAYPRNMARSHGRLSDKSWESLSEGELRFAEVLSEDSEEDALEETSEESASSIIYDDYNSDSQHHSRIYGNAYIRVRGNNPIQPSSSQHPVPSIGTKSGTCNQGSNKRIRSNNDNKNTDGGDDGDDDGPSQPRRTKIKTNTRPPANFFACPYSKFDLARYSEQNISEKEYRKCVTCVLENIPRLKTHLYRVHQKPDHYCAVCNDVFDSRPMLNQHWREENCSKKEEKFLEKMSEEQLKRIRKRNMGKTQYQNWFKIFEIFFPNAATPFSPYAGEREPGAMTVMVEFFTVLKSDALIEMVRARRRDRSLPQFSPQIQSIVDRALNIIAPSPTWDDPLPPMIEVGECSTVNETRRPDLGGRIENEVQHPSDVHEDNDDWLLKEGNDFTLFDSYNDYDLEGYYG